MLSRAFRIGTLLCLSILATQIAPGTSSEESENIGTKFFVKEAVRLCVFKTFLQSFTKYTLPAESDVANGAELYSKMKESGFEETGQSGTSFVALPLDSIKKIVNLWTLDNWVCERMISSEEVANINNILLEMPFKTILEHAFVRNGQEIIYGTTGFVELTGRNDTERRGTHFHSFRKFKISRPVNVTYRRENVDSGKCTLWGQFCPTIFKVDTMSDSESKSLFSYFRSEALKHFVEFNGHQEYIKDQSALLFDEYLPQTFKDSLTKMENSPNKLPNELFDEDPFIAWY